NYEKTKKQTEEKLNNLQQQRINQAFTCRGICGKVVGLDEKAYTWEGESGYYCQNCIVNKINQEYDKKPSHQPTNQSICSLSTIEKITKNQEVDIDSLNLPEADKVSLRAGQKIMKGEAVNIDNLAIDNEDKEVLKELQKEKNNPSSSAYKVNCQDCGKNYQSIVVPARCQHCRSRKIKVYDEAGFLQILPPDSQEDNGIKNKKNGGLESGDLAFVIIANLIF
ncbi:3824_t:CDS:2, partial [Diversispora eburnea]